MRREKHPPRKNPLRKSLHWKRQDLDPASLKHQESKEQGLQLLPFMSLSVDEVDNMLAIVAVRCIVFLVAQELSVDI